ncbi:MAG: CHAT domain-containing protein [Pseudomonadota bacterium]|nr:CHAT domain-containing protein [Pseudomonadota bacterium]
MILGIFDEDEVPSTANDRAADAKRAAGLREVSRKYARVFATYGGARVTHTMRLRADEGEPPTAFGRIIGMHERIKKYTSGEQGSLPADEDLIEFGGDLFETLFQGDVKRLYDEARSRNARRKLNVVFTSKVPWIAEKPWEFAYDKGRGTFLATEDTHFVRNALTAIPTDEIELGTGGLRMLVAAAQPVGFGELSIDQEVRIIRRGFKELEDAGLASIDVMANVSPEALQAKLANNAYSIVHFIGHGAFEDGEGKLVFEGKRGQEMRLGERGVRELFCKRGLSLVFLNSCQSASGALSEFNKGLAQSLMARGLPALVANQYSVLDSSAASFSKTFYRALAQGRTLGEAACEARIAVNCSMQGENIDWAVPVVYARSPSMVFCRPPGTAAASHKRAVRKQTVKSKQTMQPVKVAVWDMDDAFPSLLETLERMNVAQPQFYFDNANVSTPLDIWDLSERSPDDGPYLHAEKLARRIRGMTARLGVEVLGCITRHWMRSSDTLNIFGWWEGDKKSSVLIFSCAGFDDLPPEGPKTDRVIANVTVTALAGYLSNLGTHDKGDRHCPFYYNAERDFSLMVGRQKFDESCRDKVLKKLGSEQLAALDKLLTLFHAKR